MFLLRDLALEGFALLILCHPGILLELPCIMSPLEIVAYLCDSTPGPL